MQGEEPRLALHGDGVTAEVFCRSIAWLSDLSQALLQKPF